MNSAEILTAEILETADRLLKLLGVEHGKVLLIVKDGRTQEIQPTGRIVRGKVGDVLRKRIADLDNGGVRECLPSEEKIS